MPALLVLDAQKIYTSRGSELFCRRSDATMSNINRLIDAFEAREWPIGLVRHVHADDGSDLGRMFDFAGEADDFNFKASAEEVDYDPRLRRARGAREFLKHRYSAFRGTGLAEWLTQVRTDRVVVVGFMTNFCCDATAKDAHDRDYYVDFIPDATGCPDLPGLRQERIRSVVAATLSGGFAVVKTTDEYLRSL